eukprot:jgi/Botrbrau1/16468/Bobra.0142s0062.1
MSTYFTVGRILLFAWISLCAYVGWKLRRTWRFFFEIKRRADAVKDLPGPEYGFFGIMDVVRNKNCHRWATAMADKYGPIFKCRIFHYHVIAITDPLLARHVLRSKYLDKFRFMYSFLDEFTGGTNLLTGHTDAHWKTVRKGVAPAFSVANMKAAFEDVRERCDKLLKIFFDLGVDNNVNVDNLLLRESMDVIGRVGFEKEMGALEAFMSGNSETGPGKNVRVMLEATNEIVERFEHPVDHVFKFWDPKVRYGHQLMAHWQGVVREMLHHVQTIKGGTRKGTFANLLLKCKDYKTGAGLTEGQMVPEIAALFFAGIDTTGHTGTWSLYLLSQHPEVEAKVLEELDGLGLLVTPENPNPRRIEWADLGKMAYLQATIKEVLRMYPPVGLGQVRVCHTHDLMLCGGKLFVPKGTALWVPHHAMHNTKHNWDQPEKFLPERWLTPGCEYAQNRPMPKEWYEGWADELDEGGVVLQRSASKANLMEDGPKSANIGDIGGQGYNSADLTASVVDEDGKRPKRYFPFAEGPRNCVGQSLAQVTLPVTLATLLSRFHFKLAEEMGGAEGVAKSEVYTLVTGLKSPGMLMHAIPRPGVVVPPKDAPCVC